VELDICGWSDNDLIAGDSGLTGSDSGLIAGDMIGLINFTRIGSDIILKSEFKPNSSLQN